MLSMKCSSNENKHERDFKKAEIKRRDFIGLYAPALYVMCAISTFFVCLCFLKPSPAAITGPGGSDMICAFYYLLHIILWIPIGLTLTTFQFLRHGEAHYRTTFDTSSSDKKRLFTGLALSIALMLISAIMMRGSVDFYWVLLTSIVVNVPLTLLFFSLGQLLCLLRKKAAISKQAKQ